MAEILKQWSAIIAAIGLVVAISVRFLLLEGTVETHTIEIKENKILDAQQTTILDRLTGLREADDAVEKAAQAARNKICRDLRESGKINKGECPPLED